MAKQHAKEPAKKPAKKAAKPAPPVLRDDGEDIYLMEPMRVSWESGARPVLTDLVRSHQEVVGVSSRPPKGLGRPTS